MPELRIDPLSGLRVIVAGDRGDRPGAWLGVPERPPIDREGDPFAEGHEDRTPPETWALRPGGGAADTPGWKVRVVPNLYPALSPEAGEAATDPLSEGRGEPSLFASRPATGVHEVIVNGPQSVHSLLELDAAQVAAAMGAWKERIRAASDAAYVHVSVNEGREAGASLPHTHAQLYGLSFVPSAVARERERFTAYSDRTAGRNLLEDLLQEEVRRRDRLVAVDSEAVAICPYGSRVPWHVQVLPRKPVARYEDDEATGAAMLHEVLGRLSSVLGGHPPLNLWLRTAPRGAERFCWRIDVLPRLTQFAGLELGTGVHLVVLTPERAAERLREA